MSVDLLGHYTDAKPSRKKFLMNRHLFVGILLLGLQADIFRNPEKSQSKMSPETTSAVATPQAFVSAGIDHADQLRSRGELQAAAQTLEQGVQAARATPYEIEFATRIRLGMTLADVYLALNRAY